MGMKAAKRQPLMSYHITQAQWDVMSADSKVVTSDGKRYFRDRRAASALLDFELVEVVIEDHPAFVEPPAHYAHCWPLDPRD